MKTREIKVNDAKPLTVVMEEDAREMDEVVVVAYGTQLKRNVTGSLLPWMTLNRRNPKWAMS